MRFTTDELKAILTGLNWVSDQHSVGWDRERTMAHWALVDKVCSGIRGDGLYEERPTPAEIARDAVRDDPDMQQLKVPKGVFFVADGNRPEDRSGADRDGDGSAKASEVQHLSHCMDLFSQRLCELESRAERDAVCLMSADTKLNNKCISMEEDIETLDDTVGKHEARIERLQQDSIKHQNHLNNHASSIVRLVQILARAGNVDAQDILNALEGK